MEANNGFDATATAAAIRTRHRAEEVCPVEFVDEKKGSKRCIHKAYQKSYVRQVAHKFMVELQSKYSLTSVIDTSKSMALKTNGTG